MCVDKYYVFLKCLIDSNSEVSCTRPWLCSNTYNVQSILPQHTHTHILHLSQFWVLGIFLRIHSLNVSFIYGFGKGRGTRDQIANICWIIEKARELQKNIYVCIIDYAKAFDCVDNKLKNSEKDGTTRPPDLPLETPVCRSGSNS